MDLPFLYLNFSFTTSLFYSNVSSNDTCPHYQPYTLSENYFSWKKRDHEECYRKHGNFYLYLTYNITLKWDSKEAGINTIIDTDTLRGIKLSKLNLNAAFLKNFAFGACLK